MKKTFELIKNGRCVPVLVEDEAFTGVDLIAQKVVGDLDIISGGITSYIRALDEVDEAFNGGCLVLFATLGKSPLLEDLVDRELINAVPLGGVREVYGVKLVENPWVGVGQALVIYGCDKRGTIFGMFHLSELVGVSPLVFWGDAKPSVRTDVVFDDGIEMISKEPSVAFRGFFINDEWPCFGNWTFEHFGGFTVEMYDKVFELLLRLKGNYLWLAMWTSSFAVDGPGLASAELADVYGVVIGNSHHEPCLRASEEWDLCRGDSSVYGNEWNFYTNREGLLRYWEDGLKRSGKYEGVVTMGMRGERDSSMLGPDASLKDNIDLLKDIIVEQNKLIEKYVNLNGRKVPKLLALYKEVEEYFYGDGITIGLKDWEVLDDVILMLCEDNLGNMRSLPTKDMRLHKGGYGMYYHFDYHGDPISYEWVNSTPISKVWEQMTQAYEYGVRDVWIVNVGDLKFNEFPLCYFMNLAYDFDSWGTTAPNTTGKFTMEWLKQQFGAGVSDDELNMLAQVQEGYVRFNGIRRPEALNSHIYHPVHFLEADRMLKLSNDILDKANYLYDTLKDECLNAYYSMIYFPAVASMNLLQMHLYAGKNEHYAKQGKKIANEYLAKVTLCIDYDRALAKDFGVALKGKWNGMELASHIGFTKWNEDNCRYPIRMQVEPAYKPRMVVSRADDELIAVKDYFAPMIIEVKDFVWEPNDRVNIEIANDGVGSFTYDVVMEPCPWLTYSRMTDTVGCQEILTLHCDRDKLPRETAVHKVMVEEKDTKVCILVYGRAVDTVNLRKNTFLENDGTVVIEANHYEQLKATESGSLVLLEDFGRSGCGLKAFPLTRTFEIGKGPSVVYSVFMEMEDTYELEVYMAPSNPMEKDKGMCYSLLINNGENTLIDSIPDGFRAGVPHNKGWTKGVLDNVRCSKSLIQLKQGYNKIEIGMIDPGFVLERIIIYKQGCSPKASYLGPMESYFKK